MLALCVKISYFTKLHIICNYVASSARGCGICILAYFPSVIYYFYTILCGLQEFPVANKYQMCSDVIEIGLFYLK